MKLKVCGLSNFLEVETCVSLNVDYCGFILNYPESHRYVTLEKAKKLYSQAFKKFDKAYLKDKKNPDILNYLGYTSRKSGNFSAAEDYYLKGLSINPKHNGINEYLGELYVQTNRIDKANERLEILKNCNCDEYKELELIIKTRGTKIY